MKQPVETHVLGCKVNYADARRVLASLPDSPAMPVALVGTCCVTAEGEKQSRKQVRRASRRLGGAGKVLVTGCASRLDPGSFASIADNVVVLDGEPDDAARQLQGFFPGTTGDDGGDDELAEVENGACPRDRTRYFIKVQDGCANHCSYCVIPRVRGKPRSIPADKLMREAEAAAASGYPELVVSGINVGAYRDGDMGLGGLLGRLSRVPRLARLRLSSIEAVHLTPELLSDLAGLGNFASHLHVPMQSGDDRILADMGRRYDGGGYAALIADARRRLSGLNVTTDAIVGYPGEDQQAFLHTMELLEAIGASKVHVFSFSPRPGTAAARKDGRLSDQAVKKRSGELRALSDSLGRTHRRRKLDRVSEVLLESAVEKGEMAGFSDDYTRFVVYREDDAAPELKAGTIVKVMGTGVSGVGVRGKVIE